MNKNRNDHYTNSDLQNSKSEYEDIIIPEELSTLTQELLAKNSKQKKNTISLIWKYGMSSVAVLIVALTIALNTNQAFAMTLLDMPVISHLARILTVRSYEEIGEESDSVHNIKVELPAIVDSENPLNDSTVTNDSLENGTPITDINAEIERISEDYIKAATQRAEEYKEAFLATGGTEEEWAEHDIQISVSYDIKAETDQYLSFVLYATENWTGAYQEAHFYNLDRQTGKAVTLDDLLGTEYITIANESILTQMDERLANDANLMYFGQDMGGFESISDITSFYINGDGNPVIYFPKYEIAPGAFGAQEFEIKK